MDQIDNMDQFDRMDQIDNMDQFDRMDQIDHMDQAMDHETDQKAVLKPDNPSRKRKTKEPRSIDGMLSIPASIFAGVDMDQEMHTAMLLHDYACEYMDDHEDDKVGATSRYFSIMFHLNGQRKKLVRAIHGKTAVTEEAIKSSVSELQPTNPN